MKISAQFDYSKVDHNLTNKVNLLISITAPSIDWIAERPKICVLPTIDISGSMAGGKLDYAKKSCRKLIEQLKDGDYAGLVTFTGSAEVVEAPRPITPEYKAQLLSRIDKLHTVGDTNYSDAIVKSLDALRALDLDPSFTQRVIFFTDGVPTTGVVDKDALKVMLSAQLGRASVSFFGYGAVRYGGGCDQDFLSDMSDLGKGNYAYIQNPDDSLAAFGKELGGLLSSYASDLTLVVQPKHGHKILRAISEVSRQTADEDLGDWVIPLGGILAEETRHVVLECELQSQASTPPREVPVFDVSTNYVRTSREGSLVHDMAKTSAKVQFVREKDVTQDSAVGHIVALHQVVRAQIEAEEKAKSGRFQEAHEHLAQMACSFQAQGLHQYSAFANQTAAGYINPAAYTVSAGYRNSVRRSVTRQGNTSRLDADAEVALAGVGLDVEGTSAQVAFASSFTSDSTSGGTSDEPLIVTP